MIKVGDRVRNIRTEAYKDEPIVVIDKSWRNISRSSLQTSIPKCLYGSEYEYVILG